MSAIPVPETDGPWVGGWKGNVNVSPADVQAAATRIAGGGVHRTMIATSSAIDDMAGVQIFFKCENMQRVGAFKFRGLL
jgi:threonine dehydratase